MPDNKTGYIWFSVSTGHQGHRVFHPVLAATEARGKPPCQDLNLDHSFKKYSTGVRRLDHSQAQENKE